MAAQRLRAMLWRYSAADDLINLFTDYNYELEYGDISGVSIQAQRTQRIYELTQAPANRNRAVLFPAELKFFFKV